MAPSISATYVVPRRSVSYMLKTEQELIELDKIDNCDSNETTIVKESLLLYIFRASFKSRCDFNFNANGRKSSGKSKKNTLASFYAVSFAGGQMEN